jgi:hypothetical protein
MENDMSEKRRNPAYSKADLKRWTADMTMRQPTNLPSSPFVNGAEIVSFACGDTDTGILVILRDANNNTQTISLNPIVAHALRAAILQCGKAGKWMDNSGQVMAANLPSG